MGYEVTCRVNAGNASGEAKVLLETDELIIRGPAPLRFRVPRSDISAVKSERSLVTVTHGSGVLALDLGSEEMAEKWRTRLSAPPKRLLDKLGVTPEAVVSVVAVKDADFLSQLAERVPGFALGRPLSNSDLIFLGVESESDLGKIGRVAKSITSDGALWVIHPKGAAGVSDRRIFEVARECGLAYTKVARFSSTHTAEKLVIPRSRR